jgi:two-component system, NtrC family, response regulator AtoC
VFLDEVAEMPLATQAKLLRVLESGEVLRIGSLRPKRVDVRFVAATNRVLESCVAEGRFRADLYYRLDGLALVIPPLRDRRADILPLAERFARAAAARMNLPPPALGAAARRSLEEHGWPGNVRELRHVVERAVAIARGKNVLQAEHIVFRSIPGLAGPAGPAGAMPAHPRDTVAPPEAPVAGAPAERVRIEEALRRTSGNQTEAAKLLGYSRRTLVTKIERHGIGRPRKR